MITSEQIKAARALIRWNQTDLSEKAKVSLPTIKRIEAAEGSLKGNFQTVSRLVEALQNAGIEFIENGVRKSN